MAKRRLNAVQRNTRHLILAFSLALTPKVVHAQGGPPAPPNFAAESSNQNPFSPPPPFSAESTLTKALQEEQRKKINSNASLIQRVAAVEGKTPQEVVLELSGMPTDIWGSELARRMEAEGAHARRAKFLLTKGLFPRPSSVGLLEMNLTAGLDGYKWQDGNPGLVDVEAKFGLRMLLLPFATTNFGMYLSSEFAIPLQGANRLLDEIANRADRGLPITQQEIQGSRIISNRWDISGGLHGRLFAFGSGTLWRGIFGTLGYRGSLWGGTGHGIEAGFGLDVYKVRIGATFFQPMSGLLKEQGGQVWGCKLEWRFATIFPGSGL